MAGSGVTFSNLSTYSAAHALIVGSDFKRYGRLYYHIFFKLRITAVITYLLILIENRWDQDIDVNRVQQLMETVGRIRDKQCKI